MRFPRSSGILLHPTCLPGPFGVGDLGFQAFAFVDFLTDGPEIVAGPAAESNGLRGLAVSVLR